MNGKHISHYLNLGYSCSHGQEVEVKIEDVAKTSKVKVDVICDYCGSKKLMKLCDYNMSISKGGRYSCKKCYPQKIKENNIIKYGVESTNQLKEVKETKMIKLMQKYGVDNISKISQDKVRKTKLKNHGNENYNNRDKAKMTTKKRFGFENALQNKDLFEKQQKAGFVLKNYNNLRYRGTYELDFLIMCEKLKIKVEEGKSFRYYFESKKRIYHSDFYLPEYNLICEIKSNYYYNRYLQKNLLKKRTCEKKGFAFLFIIDKNYESLLKLTTGTHKI